MAFNALNTPIRLASESVAATNLSANQTAAGYLRTTSRSTEWISGEELIESLRGPAGRTEMDNLVGVALLGAVFRDADDNGIYFECSHVNPDFEVVGTAEQPVTRVVPVAFPENTLIDWDAATLFALGVQVKVRVFRHCWYRIRAPFVALGGTPAHYADVIINT